MPVTVSQRRTVDSGPGQATTQMYKFSVSQPVSASPLSPHQSDFTKPQLNSRFNHAGTEATFDGVRSLRLKVSACVLMFSNKNCLSSFYSMKMWFLFDLLMAVKAIIEQVCNNIRPTKSSKTSRDIWTVILNRGNIIETGQDMDYNAM